MTGSRIKHEGEQIPVIEAVGLRPGPTVQFRYDFKEIENEEGDHLFVFKYVNVHKYDRDTIVSAIIRTRYSQDRVEAIMRKNASGEDVIEFVKYKHFVAYAKSAFDQNDLSVLKSAEIFEIAIPLQLTLSGGDYAQMADRSIKLNIPFESDAINETAKAYPSWLTSDDLSLFENDPRVTITKLKLFNEEI